MAFPPVPFQEWFLRQTSTGNAALNAYVARVKADGGVVEAIGCVPLAVWDWAAPSFVGLLDLYPNAAAAYSLRKLRAAYSGAAVRVRESGGNTEADIGFTSAGELDTAALLAHCGANDGFVTTWYDQSLTNDATQTTASNQPKIVSAGSLVTENGKAAIQFDGVDDIFAANALAGLSRLDLFFVTQTTDTQYVHFSGVSSLTERGFTAQATNALSGLTANMGTPTMYNNGVQFTGTTRDDVYVAQNGYQVISYINANTTAFSDFGIGGFGSFIFSGKFQELIGYPSDQSANRTAIETNINNFYSIYP